MFEVGRAATCFERMMASGKTLPVIYGIPGRAIRAQGHTRAMKVIETFRSSGGRLAASIYTRIEICTSSSESTAHIA
jgi:hypothetical protein